MTPRQRAVKQAVLASESLDAEKVVCKRNGTVEVKHGYFYRHGNTADGWAGRVKKVLDAAGISANVYGRDDWAA